MVGRPRDTPIDRRTEWMKAQGCCPAAILPPDEVPDDEPYVECIDGEKTTCTGTGPDGTVYTGTKTCDGGAWGNCIPNKEDEKGDNCSKGSVPSNSKVNVKSGNLYHDQDVGILNFSYNSIDANDGSLGKKWTHNFNRRITEQSGDNTLIFDADDGNVFLFTLAGGIYYARESSSEKSQITKNADGTFTRTLKNGTVETYNSAGKLTSVTERSGRTTTLTYSGNDLISITDAAGRITNLTNSSGKITAITNSAGQTYTLAYTNGLLASITDPVGQCLAIYLR